jgi:apolipoprotein N-acyltransferase
MIRFRQACRRIRGWRRSGLAALAGMLLALALPPIGLWPLMFLGVPLFLALLEGADSRRTALLLGWLFGLGYFVVALHWIGFAFLVDASTYLWMMPFMVGGLAGGMAIYWALAALAVRLARLHGIGIVLGFAAALAVAEWLRGHLFTGFPWAVPGLIAESMGAVAQSAAVIGMTGLTLMIVMWAGLPLVLIPPVLRRERWLAAALLALLPAVWILGAWRLASPEPPATERTVRIVQPNISQDDKWRSANARGIFDTLQQLSLAPTPERPAGLAGVDYLIWPESAVPFLIDESPGARSEIARMLDGRGALVTGAIRRQPVPGTSDYRIFNSIIVFDGSGEVAVRYDKWRLVPGGEFLPFEWLLEPLGFRRVVTVPGSFAAGRGPETLQLPGGLAAAMLVCYEVIFPHDLVDHDRRPAAIINVTNDGWFGNSTGPYQHLAQARLRAIETGLPILRAANTGISAVIDARGRLVRSFGLGRQGVIDARIPAAHDPTIYALLGDFVLMGLVLVACLMVLVVTRFQARATRDRPKS